MLIADARKGNPTAPPAKIVFGGWTAVGGLILKRGSDTWAVDLAGAKQAAFEPAPAAASTITVGGGEDRPAVMVVDPDLAARGWRRDRACYRWGVADSRDERARARAGWPVARYRLGEEPADLLDGVAPADCVAMVWQLTLDAWTSSGQPMPDYSRAMSPGRVLRRHVP